MTTTEYTRTRAYQKPFFDVGRYEFKIKGATLNNAGDPALNMEVIDSFDGRRVGAYYFRNFHHAAATSAKSRALWERKFDMLLEALNIKHLNSLSELVGRIVAVEFTKAGIEPLPNFIAITAERPVKCAA